MGRFLSLGMIDSVRERERNEEWRVVQWLMRDRPVDPTYRQQQKQKTKTKNKTKQRLLKPYVDGRNSWRRFVRFRCNNISSHLWGKRRCGSEFLRDAISSYNPKLYTTAFLLLFLPVFVIKAKASSHYALNWSIVFLVRGAMGVWEVGGGGSST